MYLICVWVFLAAHIYVHHRGQKRKLELGTGGADGHEQECWGPNLGPLQELQVLFTAEQSFYPSPQHILNKLSIRSYRQPEQNRIKLNYSKYILASEMQFLFAWWKFLLKSKPYAKYDNTPTFSTPVTESPCWLSLPAVWPAVASLLRAQIAEAVKPTLFSHHAFPFAGISECPIAMNSFANIIFIITA